MNHYYSVEGRLYSLTQSKENKLNKLFPDLQSQEENHEQRLQWIEENGKYLGDCENLAY